MVNGTPLPVGPTTDTPREAPVRVNQQDESKLAIATNNNVYLATDDVTASHLSKELDLKPINPSNNPFNLEKGVDPVMAYGRPGNANLLLVGAGKDLYLSTTLQPNSLQQLSSYTGTNTITSVCINANSDNVFYVADGSVVRSNTGNQGAWVIGLALPNLQSLQFITNGLNAVVAGGYGTLYAARDTDLNNWYSLKGNLPNTFVWQMDYSSKDDLLAVGTLGRGAFTLANASTLMPALPFSVDTGWIRLLGANSGDQTLNGGTVQNPTSATLPMNLNFTLTNLGGTFDTNGLDPTSGSSTTLNGVIADQDKNNPGSLTITGNGTLFLAACQHLFRRHQL